MAGNDNKTSGPFGGASGTTPRDGILGKSLDGDSKMPNEPQNEETQNEDKPSKSTKKKKAKKKTRKPVFKNYRNIAFSDEQIKIIDKKRGLVPFAVYVRDILERKTDLFK